MSELFHLTERACWDRAAAAGDYRTSTRGRSLEQQGFIHCALRHQLRGVADRWFDGAADLVVLVIDTGRLGVPVRYESAGPGLEAFPHVYGPIPAAAVTAVIDAPRDDRGRLVLPEP